MSVTPFEKNFACSEIYELSIISELMEVSQTSVQRELVEKALEGEFIASTMNRLDALNLDEVFPDDFFQPYWSLLFLKADIQNIQYLHQKCGFSMASQVAGESFILKTVLPIAKHSVIFQLFENSIFPPQSLKPILTSQLFSGNIETIKETGHLLSENFSKLHPSSTQSSLLNIAHIMLYESYYYSAGALDLVETGCSPDGLLTRLSMVLSPLDLRHYFLQIQSFFDFIDNQNEKKDGFGYFLTSDNAPHHYALAQLVLHQDTASVFCSGLIHSKLSLDEKMNGLLSFFEHDRAGVLDYFSDKKNLQQLLHLFSSDFLNKARFLPLLKEISENRNAFSTQEILDLVGASISNQKLFTSDLQPSLKDQQRMKSIENRMNLFYPFLFSLNPPPNYTLGFSADGSSHSFYKSAISEFLWLAFKTDPLSLHKLQKPYDLLKDYFDLHPNEHLPDLLRECFEQRTSMSQLKKQLKKIPMTEQMSLLLLMRVSDTVKPAASKRPAPGISRF